MNIVRNSFLGALAVGGLLFVAGCEDKECKEGLAAATTQVETLTAENTKGKAEMASLQAKAAEAAALKGQVESLTKEIEALKAAEAAKAPAKGKKK